MTFLDSGETGAGKSSFINLLLGEEILPVDHALSTTSCICEIHHSEHKKVSSGDSRGCKNELILKYLV